MNKKILLAFGMSAMFLFLCANSACATNQTNLVEQKLDAYPTTRTPDRFVPYAKITGYIYPGDIAHLGVLDIKDKSHRSIFNVMFDNSNRPVDIECWKIFGIDNPYCNRFDAVFVKWNELSSPNDEGLVYISIIAYGVQTYAG